MPSIGLSFTVLVPTTIYYYYYTTRMVKMKVVYNGHILTTFHLCFQLVYYNGSQAEEDFFISMTCKVACEDWRI
jgi:hypothetical protein